MQIDSNARVVRLSVGELATFRNFSNGGTHQGRQPWRAAVGQSWHKTVKNAQKALTPDARFEVSVDVTWKYKDWTLLVRGRVDQIVPDAVGYKIVEVKTVRLPLPMDSESLLQRYPNISLRRRST